MSDNGEPPLVGMECLMAISKKDKGTTGYIEFKNEIGFLFRYADNNLCDFYENCDSILFEPIDNRSDKEKAMQQLVNSYMGKDPIRDKGSEFPSVVCDIFNAIKNSEIHGVTWSGK